MHYTSQIAKNSIEDNKICILWGGGLGDILVIRPLLMAIHNSGIESFLFTTATHMEHFLREFCFPTKIIFIDRTFNKIVEFIKRWAKEFKFVYIGPYPTIKTKLLGHMLLPRTLWNRKYKNISPFILEQIIEDVKQIGLKSDTLTDKLYGYLPWNIKEIQDSGIESSPYIVLHPGAKEKWKTTKWPTDNWRELISLLLQKSDIQLFVIGTREEAPFINRILRHITSEQEKKKIKITLSLPLKKVAQLIHNSKGVICHNSGILHLSTFLHKSTVSITGSSAKFWRPPYPWVFNVTSGECNLACNSYSCPLPFYRARCINDLPTEKVWQAVKEHILNKKS